VPPGRVADGWLQATCGEFRTTVVGISENSVAKMVCAVGLDPSQGPLDRSGPGLAGPRAVSPGPLSRRE
jgi:hypothetical protein